MMATGDGQEGKWEGSEQFGCVMFEWEAG